MFPLSVVSVVIAEPDHNNPNHFPYEGRRQSAWWRAGIASWRSLTVAHYTLTDGRFRKETKRTQIICKSDKSLSIYSLHFINPGKLSNPAGV